MIGQICSLHIPLMLSTVRNDYILSCLFLFAPLAVFPTKTKLISNKTGFWNARIKAAVNKRTPAVSFFFMDSTVYKSHE